MASNAKITSEGSPVAQTPVVTKARRVRKPSAPVKKVYHVGSKAVILDPHKIVGTITELTNCGSISATIKIDADGRVVNATLNPSDDFWYRPKKTATLFFPGVPGAAVTLAHQRLPQTVEDPKPVPREALGLPPLPAGACDSDSDSADQNNAVKRKKRTVDQNKGKEAQGKNKAIASGSEPTYTATRVLEVPPKDVSEPLVSSSDHTLESGDDISNKGSAATSLASGSPLNTELAGSTSTNVPLTTTKNMAPRAQSETKRKRDATAGGDASKRPKNENGGSTTVETLEDGSKVIYNYNGNYFDLRGANYTLQLPQASAPRVIPQGHQHVVYYDAVYGYRYQTFAPQPGGPTAQGAAAAPRPASQAPIPYQVPPQAGSLLAPYGAAQPQGPPTAPYSTGAPAPASYYDQTSHQNSQASPYATDTRFRDQTSPVASSQGPGTYSQHPQYPQ
ncbi:hypothetical protein BDN71DRAFT_1448027 [Pleurotus eryngii]|uniref:Uncharacterized protein n=1 Tax=Pleurotus eryngii TaxID=5323 RepID=A0A9P5ZWG3_PLEER|nr:hypothetical protein BDN71DRAFT_1448027 [Pleurotus eryngii]